MGILRLVVAGTLAARLGLPIGLRADQASAETPSRNNGRKATPSCVSGVPRLLLRSLGLNRPKPKTRLDKFFRRSERAITLVMSVYVALHAFPQVLFGHSITRQGVTPYARSPIPAEAAAARIGELVNLVKESELAVPGRKERIFLCNHVWLYRLFGPTQRQSVGFSDLTGNVFTADADLGLIKLVFPLKFDCS